MNKDLQENGAAALMCLNPLKSGHMYWINHQKFNATRNSCVLIPLNRVICIEYWRVGWFDSWRDSGLNPLKSGHMYWMLYKWCRVDRKRGLNPLKSGHMYWIKVVDKQEQEYLSLNPLKSGHMYWMYILLRWWEWGLVLIPLNRVICIE